MLEGFDDRWSSWTSDARRDYTNLPAGEYVFRVRARNTYEQESEPASFTFKVIRAFNSSLGVPYHSS